MTTIVEPRDSIYHLALLASTIQVELRYEDGASRAHSHSVTSAGRTLNHLSTLLSRGGIITEEIVAVTALFDADGGNVWVVTSPATSPASPRVSPSSSAGVSNDGVPIDVSPDAAPTRRAPSPSTSTPHDLGSEEEERPSDDNESGSHSAPSLSTSHGLLAPSTLTADPHTETDSEATPHSAQRPWENNITRNSASGDSEGRLFRHKLDAGSTGPELLNAIPGMSRESLSALSFTEYTTMTIELLRSAAFYIKANRHTQSAAQTGSDVLSFFAKACRNKIKARLRHFVRTFGLKNLDTWVPADGDIFVKSTISVTNSAILRILDKLGLKTIANNKFPVEISNISIWFSVLVRSIRMIQRGIEMDIMEGVAVVSKGLHQLIRDLLTTMWHMRSLALHLEYHLEKATYDQAQSKTSGEDQEDDPTDDTVGVDHPLPNTVHPVCMSFHRMADAICAWTTAAQYLLKTPIATSSMTINISVVDFPRCPIKEVSLENLIRHWKTRAGWSDTLGAAVDIEMRAVELSQTTKGAVHCEAGLVASLLLRLRKPQDLNAAEPQVLVDAFASVTEKLTDDIHFTIGMAKKCCPVCRMLVELLQAAPTNLKVEFAGGHSRFPPWVPPHWLPISVLHKLEKGLLQKIAEMVADRDDFKASRSSSTTKYDFSDDFPVTGNALLTGFPVD